MRCILYIGGEILHILLIVHHTNLPCYKQIRNSIDKYSIYVSLFVNGMLEYISTTWNKKKSGMHYDAYVQDI